MAITQYRRLSGPRPHAWRRAFTLVELLVVLAVIAILTVLTLPSLSGLLGSNTFSSNLYALDGALQQARTYAMANNTYVYVALSEVAGTSTLGHPTAGNGRVVVLVAAVSDGTDGITGNGTYTFSNANLIQINKLISLDGLHLVDVSGQTTGNMARPSLTAAANTGAVNVSAPTPVDGGFVVNYPLSGSAIYKNFPYVIGFDPTGSAFYVTSLTSLTSTSPVTIPYIEIGLQPMHGNTAPATVSGNYAAIQIDGLSGISHVYRP